MSILMESGVGQLQRCAAFSTSLPAATHEVKVQASAQKPMNEANKQVTIGAGKNTTMTASLDASESFYNSARSPF